MTTLTARPEAITFDPQQSALIVVDMQNAYATPGGYLDLAGFDVSTTRPVIANIQTAVTAARAAGMLIIWFQNGWDEQYVEAGGCIDSREVRKKPGRHWIIRDLTGLDLVGLASL
ncbi:isochorismatase family protein [Escherichia coli]